MKIIKPAFPLVSIIFWILILIAIGVFSNRDSIGTYAFAFIPVHLISIIIRFFFGKIVISDNILSARILFDKFEVDLTKVRSFEIKKRNLFFQIIAGIPSEVTVVEYNKYDTLQLNSADPELLEALSSYKEVEVK